MNVKFLKCQKKYLCIENMEISLAEELHDTNGLLFFKQNGKGGIRRPCWECKKLSDDQINVSDFPIMWSLSAVSG